MTSNAPQIVNNFSNVKVNKDMNLNLYETYGTKKFVSFNTVVEYSTNRAMIFYIGASVFNAYVISTTTTLYLTTNQKYIYFALSLYLTQIIYNYLDINSDSNLDRYNLMNQP